MRGRDYMAAVRVKGGTVLALPKGHIDPGESAAQAAQRELREEAGVDGELVGKLGDVKYWFNWRGERIFKVVSFFLFRYRRGRIGDITPVMQREVAEARWLPLEEAERLLAYKGEREMAQVALSRLPGER